MANRNFPANKLYNSHVMPCLVDMQIAIGAAGAPTLSGAPLVNSVTRLAAGIYQIQLKDNYFSLLGMFADWIAPLSGSAADPHVISANSLIQITAVGNADWHAAGLSSSIDPAVGVTFFMTAQPSGATTGLAKLIGSSGISDVQLCGGLMNSNSPSASSVPVGQTNGAFLIVKCLAESAAITMNSYTPAGSISAGVISVAAGTAGDPVTNDAGVLNSVGGEDLSVDPQTFTGTPAVLTGSSALSSAPADPAQGSILQLAFYLNNSSVQ